MSENVAGIPIQRAFVNRPLFGRIELRAPARCGNGAWLRETLGARPELRDDDDDFRWLIARSHLRALALAAADYFGECEVTTEHRSDERCNTACQTACRDECVCSCLGRHHAGGRAVNGWIEVGEQGVLISDNVVRARRLVRAEWHPDNPADKAWAGAWLATPLPAPAATPRRRWRDLIEPEEVRL